MNINVYIQLLEDIFMQKKITCTCKNIFKNKDIKKRKEEFTKKWAEFINKCENNKFVMQK